MNHPQASPSCGFTILLSTKNGKTLGLLSAPLSFLTVLCWSFCSLDNISSSFGVPDWLLGMCLVAPESSSPPPYRTGMERSLLCEDQNSCSPIGLSMLLMTLNYEWVLTEDRAQWATELESFPFTQATVSLDSEQKVWICSNFHFQLLFLAYFVDFQRNNSIDHPIPHATASSS